MLKLLPISVIHTHTHKHIGLIPVVLHHLFAGLTSIMTALETIPSPQMAANEVAGSIPSPAVFSAEVARGNAERCTIGQF